MRTMTPEHWEQVAQLHRAALQYEESQRAAFLDDACGGDENLRCEVESLLAYEGDAENFMEVPALESVAKQLAEGQALGMVQKSGTKFGPYEILAPLGVGGMGEVYRARDTNLNRDVALKILPALFTNDAERMARFRREAQVLASLNHPNIGSIYGLEESNNLWVLVLELVEGPTLEDRINGGAVPLEEALAIAQQIAEAVAYAHEKGVTHRDLKPANIKITPEGNVKVLDFGLAKVLQEPKNLDFDPSYSLTCSNPTTVEGMILGTAAYMSPEQAKGKPVDKRADIWAFGVVLYELLTGGHLFQRETVADSLAAVLKDELDWNLIPVKVRPLLQHCLERDPKRRLRDVGDMHLLLESASVPLKTHRPWFAWSVATVFFVAGGALSLIHFRERPLVPAPVQFQISPPGSLPQGDAFAVSPDGRHLAFAATGSDGVARLWIRDLESLEVRALSDSYPVRVVHHRVVPPFFWSPDSRFIGFQAGRKLAKIEISGGPAQTLCDVQGIVVGGSWNRDGVIVFADNTRGLMQVSAAGGVASPLTTFDPSRNEVVHVLPSFLPDGRHFLYLRAARTPENSGIYVGSLHNKPEEQDSRRLLASTSGPVYVPSSDSDFGHVLFLRRGTLMAQPFDAHRLKLSGEAVQVAAQVGSFIDYGLFSASGNGVLVYRSAVGQNYQLTWLDRQGRLLGTVAEPGGYNSMALSPDGRRVAASRTNSENTPNWDVWLIDVGRHTSTRLTYDQVRATFPVWSADGSSVIFGSIHENETNLYLKLASGAGDQRLLLKSPAAEYQYATSWSRDAHFLLYTVENPGTKSDLWVLPLQGDRKPTPFLRTEFNESSGQFSPDGHWIAYTSDESGGDEIYVREFSSGSAQGSWDAASKWLISKSGGTDPRWRGDGKELFYVAPDGKLMSVDISVNHVFETHAPKPLFQLPPGFIGGDVAADGRRFLVGVPLTQNASVPFTVVMNWQTTSKK
jgi:eukaryotic-like serine/threonine-protein kinase